MSSDQPGGLSPPKSQTAKLLAKSPALGRPASPQISQIVHDKVTVVGAGQVGMACCFAMIAAGTTNHLAIIDVNQEKAQGEGWDLEHSSAFLRGGLTVEAGSDFALSKNSSVCVVTAGARQKEGESRLNLVQRNVEIFKSIIPQLVHYSPRCILLIVSNPVDILSWVAWKLSGLPPSRVVGSGTNLDSSRFRTFISQKLDVAAVNTHGYIIGEHGDSSVAVWSSVTACGVRLRDLNPQAGLPGDKENWDEIHQKVINGAYDIIKAKGYTSWAIGMSINAIVNNILRNSRLTHVLSVHAKGLFGIEQDMYIALPAIMGPTGLQKTINLNLTDHEISKLHESCRQLSQVADDLKL